MAEETRVMQSLAKVERAVEISNEIFSQCEEFIITDDKKAMMRLGSLLGDFVNNLRSALNYCARTLIINHVEAKLEPKRAKNLVRKVDFPWAKNKDAFDAILPVKTIREASEFLYKSFERFQPYHKGNDWLGHLMILSNRDKHEVINHISPPIASSVIAFDNREKRIRDPMFVGDKVILFHNIEPVYAKLPFYYPYYRAFATPKHTWMLFLIPMKDKLSLDLIEYVKTTPPKVINILSFFAVAFGDNFEKIR